MMKASAVVVALCATLTGFAAGGKADPVAEGFPNWQGAVEKNRIAGRSLSASDLRHRVTVVVEVEPGEKLQEQLVAAGGLASLNGMAGASALARNAVSLEIPRDVLFVVVSAGPKDHEAFLAALTPAKDAPDNVRAALGNLRHPSVAIYDGITFAGAPDSAGKRPFAYVMGPTGTEPLFQGQLNDGAASEVRAAVKAGKEKLAAGEKWVPFYGFYPETKLYPQLAAALQKGKLAPVAAAILKDVTSKDAGKAAEAQVVYDAINQARGELLLKIQLEAHSFPYQAVYDFRQLTKYWPAEKKRLAEVMQKINKTVPDAAALADMMGKAAVWADPNFTCRNATEVKKIITELNRMKKSLDKLKSSKIIPIQNGALMMESRLDELIGLIPTKLPEK